MTADGSLKHQPGNLGEVWRRSQKQGRICRCKTEKHKKHVFIFNSNFMQLRMKKQHCFEFNIGYLNLQFLCVGGGLDSRVVVLDHLTHRPQGRQVLVQPIWTHEVEGVGRARVTVGASEVDPHLQPSHSHASFFFSLPPGSHHLPHECVLGLTNLQ